MERARVPETSSTDPDAAHSRACYRVEFPPSKACQIPRSYSAELIFHSPTAPPTLQIRPRESTNLHPQACELLYRRETFSTRRATPASPIHLCRCRCFHP